MKKILLNTSNFGKFTLFIHSNLSIYVEPITLLSDKKQDDFFQSFICVTFCKMVGSIYIGWFLLHFNDKTIV